MSNDAKTVSSGQTVTQAPGTVASAPVTPAPLRQSKHDELRLLVNSRHPIITIETPEEERVEHVAMARIYLTRFKQDYPAMNATYRSYFPPDRLPARTCVGVTGLAYDALIEIDLIARRPSLNPAS